MASADQDTLNDIGQLMIVWAVPLVCESIFWGMYLLITIFSIHILATKGLQYRARLLLFVAIISMFAISTLLWTLDLYAFIFRTKGILLVDTPAGMSVEEHIAAVHDSVHIEAWLEELFFSIEFILGDAVVVWRTWHLWADNRRIMIFPLILLGGSVVSVLIFFGCMAKAHFPFFADEPEFCDRMELASWTISMATNALATAMIGWRAWQHRRFIREASAKSSKVERILLILVESGFIYFILWVIQTIGFADVDYGPTQIAAQIIDSIGYQIVGLYPTLIIVLVHMQRSVWDYPDVSIHVETLRFAQPSTTQTNNAGTWITGMTLPPEDEEESRKNDSMAVIQETS